jgi:hypothetical protein
MTRRNEPVQEQELTEIPFVRHLADRGNSLTSIELKAPLLSFSILKFQG